MEPERRPGRLVASINSRRLLAVLCLRVHAWQWMGGRRGGGAGGGELWGSAAVAAAIAVIAAIAAITAIAAIAAIATAGTAAIANSVPEFEVLHAQSELNCVRKD